MKNIHVEIDEDSAKELLSINKSKLATLEAQIDAIKAANVRIEKALSNGQVPSPIQNIIASASKQMQGDTPSYSWRGEINAYFDKTPTARADSSMIAKIICVRDGITNLKAEQHIKNNLSIGFSAMFRDGKLKREKKTGVEEYWYFK